HCISLFFSSRRRHTRSKRDWSSDVCSSDLGAEKMLIKRVTGRKVPSGGLPADVGCVVSNISTTKAIADAIQKGMPLVERVVTVRSEERRVGKEWCSRIGQYRGTET